MKYFLIAGEASGDLHAGRLVAALRKADGNAEFRYLGGDCMEEASGVAPVIHYKRMAYMAFSEVLRHLPDILGNMKAAKAAIADFRPDAVILVDYPSFNLKIAEYAYKNGIPAYYYISPKVWAWKEWRVKSIKKYIRKVFSILPFETEFYARHGFKVDYVGNPTVNEITEIKRNMPGKSEFLAAAGIPDDKPLIALLPGSRAGEIRNNLPLMVKAAMRFPAYRFVVAGAPNVSRAFYRETLANAAIGIDPDIVSGSTSVLLHHAEAAVVTSGTATLETAVIGTPQVVCYRANGSRIAYKLFEKILKVGFVSLPNLIAGKEVVPELLLHLCNEDSIAEKLGSLLPAEAPGRRTMLDGYRLVAQRLGTEDSAETAAAQLISDLKESLRR